MTYTVTEQLLDLLRFELGHDIKMFYNGKLELADIPNCDCPVLTAEKINTQTIEQGTGTVKDNVRWLYRLTLWIDRKQFLENTTGQNEVENVLQTRLERIVEGLDENMDYKTDTIFGILRKNFTIGGKMFYTYNVTATYQDNIIQEESQLAKAVVDFTAERRVTRPS